MKVEMEVVKFAKGNEICIRPAESKVRQTNWSLWIREEDGLCELSIGLLENGKPFAGEPIHFQSYVPREK